MPWLRHQGLRGTKSHPDSTSSWLAKRSKPKACTASADPVEKTGSWARPEDPEHLLICNMTSSITQNGSFEWNLLRHPPPC